MPKTNQERSAKDPRDYLYLSDPSELQQFPRIGLKYPRAPWRCTLYPDGRVTPDGLGRDDDWPSIVVDYPDRARLRVSVEPFSIGMDRDAYLDQQRDGLLEIDAAAGVRPLRDVSAPWLLAQWRQCRINAGGNAAVLFRAWAAGLDEVVEVRDRRDEFAETRTRRKSEAEIMVYLREHPSVSPPELARYSGWSRRTFTTPKWAKIRALAQQAGNE